MNIMKRGRVRKVIGWKSADSRAACNPEMYTHRNNIDISKRKMILQNAVPNWTTLKFCITTSGRIPLKFVALGVKNRKSDKKNWQIRTVKKIHQHPQYINRYNDIALLELEEPITFNENVLPACLPEPAEEFDITTAKFSSWKDNNSNFGSFLDISRIRDVQELTIEECDVKIMETRPQSYIHNLLPEKVKAESQFCYGVENTCLNIIGAPLVVTTQYSRCMNTVIGVNAFADTCGPAVFTKVKHYNPWIESIIWP